MSSNEQLNNESMTEEHKKQLVKYLFQCVFAETNKILLLSIIFLKLHLFHKFLLALLVLILPRTNGGGLHFRHYTSYFVVSFFVNVKPCALDS